MTQEFDIDAAVKALQSGQDLNGENGILTLLIKQLTEAALKAELDQHLDNKITANRRNGHTQKTVKSLSGNFELDTPRDREGDFEPQLIKKHQTQLTDELERKILSMFALGMSYQDIRTHVRDLYGMTVSNGTVNAVTDKLLPELKGWQARELEPVYPFVWLDAIHYKVKENGRFISKAVYTILGLTVEGKKEL
jgi:transposase-like protein